MDRSNAPTPRIVQAKIGEQTALVSEKAFHSANPSPAYVHTPNSYHVHNHHPTQPVATSGIAHHKPRVLFQLLRYSAVVLAVALPLIIAIIIYAPYSVVVDDSYANKSNQNLGFYICLWLLITWLSACVSNVLIRIFPHIFRFVAGWINPAHRKYWRVFRVLRNPVTLTGCVIGSYGSFYALIDYNSNLILNYSRDPNAYIWSDGMNDVLFICIIWVLVYLVEKILILYISIHYHYRSDLGRIERSKRMQAALSALYEASTYLYPSYQEPFFTEDSIIRHFTSLEVHNPNNGASKFMRKIGLASDKLSDILGNLVNSDQRSHWFKPDAPYAIVGHALEHPKSAAALATRIWQSLVIEGKEALTANVIAEVLGPHRREEAEGYFKVLDENENGDIQLEEMVMTVVEAGRVRHSIFRNMEDINHAINTFDWVALLAIAATMVFFILVLYVPVIKDIKDTAGYLALGVSFAVGRTIHEFLSGCIFLFFKHAYDIGDRVEIYNLAATSSISATVTRISVLYTIFTCTSDGKDIQISNDRLNLKRIVNITRSGANKEAVSIFVDFNTTFTDIQYLQKELQSFLSDRSNSRDFLPTLKLRLKNIFELNKLELKCSFTHKSNWSNEDLRAARSSKFLCALLTAIRKIPIIKPGGPDGLGGEGKPAYTVMLNDEQGKAKLDAAKQKNLEKRMDFVKPDAKADVAPPTDGVNKLDDPEQQHALELENAAKAAEKAKKDAKEQAEQNAYKELTAVPWVPGPGPLNREHGGLVTGNDAGLWGLGAGTVAKGLRRNVGREDRSMFYPG